MSDFFNKIISSSASEKQVFESSKRSLINKIESTVRYQNGAASSWRLRERKSSDFAEA